MSRHYSTRHFFRQVPNALLKQYFDERGLLQDVDFSAMTETKVAPLFDAWMGLSEDDRKEMDAEFQTIFDLSCEKGFNAILDEIRWQKQGNRSELRALIGRLSALSSHYHRAMLTYLELHDCWRGATLFYHADTLSYWRKRRNMGRGPAAVDTESLRALAARIGEFFHLTEGRGKNCEVEYYRRGALDYYFAFPEDFSRHSTEWVDGEFGRRAHHPAFQVVFVFSENDGTLDLNFRGPVRAIEPLQEMFATEILKLKELPPNPGDLRVYDLNRLLEPGFSFVYPPDGFIERVAIRKLRLSSRTIKGDRITVEADSSRGSDAIYRLIQSIEKSIPLDVYNVTQVELSASVRKTGAAGRSSSVLVCITHPNSCSLKYDKSGLQLRKMLEMSGIELKERDQSTESGPE